MVLSAVKIYMGIERPSIMLAINELPCWLQFRLLIPFTQLIKWCRKTSVLFNVNEKEQWSRKPIYLVQYNIYELKITYNQTLKHVTSNKPRKQIYWINKSMHQQMNYYFKPESDDTVLHLFVTQYLYQIIKSIYRRYLADKCYMLPLCSFAGEYNYVAVSRARGRNLIPHDQRC